MTTLADNIRLVTGDSPHLLIVDRYSPGYLIPKKQGVGLARKIGMDIAVQLVEQGTLESSWLFTTDADVHLPANYFELEPMQADAALLPRFRHTAPKDRAIAMQLYEASMLYYVAGLRFAGSPYAYPTIGSLISCSAENYAAVRGFPKRNTGEDFYLLNKLRKLGEVRCVNHVTIEISGRNSERVPIGTGAAVTRIGGMSNPMSEFTVEHPDCYTTLRLFLTALNELAGKQPLRPFFPDPELTRYADEIGLLTHYETKRRQQPSTSVMSKHLHDWFDALKTRQLIHHLRDSRFGSVTIPSLGSASFLSGETTPGAIQAALAARIYGT